MENTSKMVAANGNFLINDTAQHDGFKGYGLFFPEETVVESLNVNDDSDDVRSSYIMTPSNPVPPNTTLYIRPGLEHRYYSSIKLTSGNCIVLIDSE